MKSIFIVTTIEDRPHLNGKRCVGWFDNLKDAEECTKLNCGDIHEGSNRWVVIEEVSKGFYASCHAAQYWFEWNPDFEEYEKCSKPRKFDSLWAFGMG